ncbi:MAG: endonuclease MutS2 [Candidatus Bipolaricaulota bacterium]|nr:endonuclease MutS2 [Candidatus Bipolaricaulota bacterium]MDW8151325.1 endonuclease MutS2 [Candidatus Bipolaricaulota bacterium]
MAEVLNARTLRDLELAKVLELVAREAASPLGAEVVRALRPQADRAWVEREFRRVEEMVEAVRGGFSPGPLHDLRPLLAEAREHGILAPQDFLPIAETLEAALGVRQALQGPRHPELAALAQRLSDQTPLLRRIWRAIDERGEIRPDATPKLRALLEERRKLTEEIQETLRRFLHHHREHVQDAVITQRGGRFVVPLKTGARALGVVVHETSGSGQTLFAEPAEAVPLNNRLRAVEDELDRERHRILAELTGLLLQESAAIEEDLRILASLDGLFARARFALRWNAAIPTFTDEPQLVLEEARHPLLGDRAVPISLAFGGEKPVAVITGPNTGGKTVTLKTIGLFCALAQAGIPIPASPRTVLPFLEKIRSDIGEEQSIEQSLSTFSSHMRNIIEILSETDERTLVLLDELGAGTDPQEGAALALALLEKLLEIGCLAAVATHLTPVKLFALAHPRVLSCSMEFDLETLAPTYRVLPGVPGRSCALLVAERLGLPRELVERARAKLSSGEIRAEEIIEELARERAAARRLRANLEAEREALRKLRAEYEKRVQALREKKVEFLDRELKKLEEEIRAARKELAELIAQARQAQTAEARREVLRRVEALAERVPEAVAEPPRRAPRPLRVGDTVRVGPNGPLGTLLALAGEEAEVEVRGKRVTLPLSALVPAEAPPAPAPKPFVPIPQTVELELSVRGLSAEEALRQVDLWLDRLLRAGFTQGRIVHGRGTGVLRQRIHEHLRTLPFVKDFRLAPPEEGGDGVTLVTLG